MRDLSEYKFLSYTPFNYPPETLSDLEIPFDAKKLLVVIGLPRLDIYDTLAFEPSQSIEPEQLDGILYYKLGVLSLDCVDADIYIDSEHGHIWVVESPGMGYVNESLSGFILFLTIYTQSIVNASDKEENYELLFNMSNYLNTAFIAVDKTIIDHKNNIWVDLLNEIKNVYPEPDQKG
ncbi:SUKH-4 family immunity protein [Xanthocytophaga flava]|uniref:SUKH-4 family immunity protein n=1 Tax=Xanthocytophaga flava TaxID=3048013 RepID=UPI0028D5F2D8|nr:SUKH-4 family immunity protein [Xanthocytophaga flavus]MDJ1473774.1 SUKH-4 family immunity protein [Xanthocytophaga flavus]